MEDDKAVNNISIIDEARKIRDEMKIENDRREKLLQEEKKLEAEKMLSSSAGGRVPQVAPKEETDKEYSDRIKREIREGKYNG